MIAIFSKALPGRVSPSNDTPTRLKAAGRGKLWVFKTVSVLGPRLVPEVPGSRL